MTDLIPALVLLAAAGTLVAILFGCICLAVRFKRALAVTGNAAAWLLGAPFRYARGFAEDIADDAAYLPLALFGLVLFYMIFS